MADGIDSQLVQNFIEKISELSKEVAQSTQASKDTARWVENLDKSLHEEFNRTRELTQKVSDQSGTIRVLDKTISGTSDDLKSHKDGHWKFAGFVISITGTLIAILNYFARKS